MPGDIIDFTVVIPVYNGAACIARAIESCLQQTFLPRQIIVIDDASTDHTADIVSGFVTGNILYQRNNQNHGPSYCRNRGIQMAGTSWIAFLDADDVFHPQKLEIIRYCLEKNTNIHAMGHSFDLLEQNKKIFNSDWSNSLPTMENLNEKDILLRNPMVTPSIVVSKENYILFNEKMVYAEDHDFILRTAEKCHIYYLDLPLCSLERLPLTPGGISSNKWKMRVGEMKLYISYARRHKYYLLIPFLILFSLLKHFKNILLQR